MPEKPFEALSKAEQKRRVVRAALAKAETRVKALKTRPSFAKFRNPMVAEMFNAVLQREAARQAVKKLSDNPTK